MGRKRAVEKSKRPAEKGPELLVAALKREQMSMGDLERKLRAADGIVSKWIGGHRAPGLGYALALEELLDIPARSWVEDERPTGTG